ncbi:unnamed protein product [Heterobilharzia americana]|nr:unnamed protein product [Heterobilharzia americana]
MLRSIVQVWHFSQQNGRRMTENEESMSDCESLLKAQDVISTGDVLKLKRATSDRNIYDIQFLSFSLRDMESNAVIFEVRKPPSEYFQNDCEQKRCVRYKFSPDFLYLRTVGATVEFSIGDKYISEFRMIERHYFKDKLLKSFDFNFGFVIPNSVNTVEHIYEFPKLTDGDVRDMIQNPFETRSDSFYFVDGALVMHNKAEYAYNG